MTDWLRNAVVYEINAWVWLREWSQSAGRPLSLADLPKKAWDQLAALGVDAVWLMGIWERSPAATAISRRDKSLLAALRRDIPGLRHEDIVGSPYSIHRSQVDLYFGGAAGLRAARQALAARGIRLLLDFVPNHVAPDHPWVTAHPDWFIRGSRANLRRHPRSFLDIQGAIFARAKDPYFPPWSDVLQLNVFHPEQRRAAIDELRQIAEQCDGVRCDMAMLVMNSVFSRTWGNAAGEVPVVDYWPEVIPAVKGSHPEFRFIAEAYWGLELTLLEQGFDACYDKGWYDALAHGSAESVRTHLLRYSPVQDRLLRFLENHDEPRAAVTFPAARNPAAVVALMTLPGIRLLQDGQLTGRVIRTPVHLNHRSSEPENRIVDQLYRKLLELTANSVFRTGQWSWCESSGWPDNQSHRHLLSWCWWKGQEWWIVVVNYSDSSAQGRVRLPWDNLVARSWHLADPLAGVVFERDGNELASAGLFVDLNPWAYHVLHVKQH